MAKKRSLAPSPRSVIALLLVGFVLVTTGVIARRVYGLGQQREIAALRKKRNALEADRIRLQGAIADGSSRSRLQPIAEKRLNMHIPKPDQQVFVTRHPTAETHPPRTAHDSL